jgi:uncharacterized protein
MLDRPPQKIHGFELAVLALFLLPGIALSYFGRSMDHFSFSMLAVSSIFQNAAFSGLVLYFVWRNREPLREVGLSAEGWEREVFAGVLLYLPFAIGVGILESILRHAGMPAPQQLPPSLRLDGLSDHLLAPIFLVAVAFSEELLFRGYLIRRIGQLMGNSWAAVLVSSLVFALGHGYAGSLGVVTIGVMGVLLGVIYLWRGSLIAPMVMHFIQNFIGLIVVPGAS